MRVNKMVELLRAMGDLNTALPDGKTLAQAICDGDIGGGGSNIAGSSRIVSPGEELSVVHDPSTYIQAQVFKFIPGENNISDSSLDFDLVDESKFIQEDASNGTDFSDGIIQIHSTEGISIVKDCSSSDGFTFDNLKVEFINGKIQLVSPYLTTPQEVDLLIDTSNMAGIKSINVLDSSTTLTTTKEDSISATNMGALGTARYYSSDIIRKATAIRSVSSGGTFSVSNPSISYFTETSSKNWYAKIYLYAGQKLASFYIYAYSGDPSKGYLKVYGSLGDGTLNINNKLYENRYSLSGSPVTITIGDFTAPSNGYYWVGITSDANIACSGYTSGGTYTNRGVTYNQGYVHSGFPTGSSDWNTFYYSISVIDRDEKYLFQDGNEIKRYDSGTWETIGSLPITKSMFDTYGMISLSGINPSTGLNSDSCKLLSLDGLSNITAVTNYSTVKEANVGYAVSFDEGVTWKSKIGGAWRTITNIYNGSMSKNELEIINVTEWNEVFEEGNMILKTILKTYNNAITPFVDTITINGADEYAIGQFTVETDSNVIDTSNWSEVNNISINCTEPEGTSLRFSLSFDGGTTWKAFKDGAFIVIDNIHQEGMTKGELEALTNVELGDNINTELGLKFGFKTTHKLLTPTLDQIVINYNEYGTWNSLSTTEMDNFPIVSCHRKTYVLNNSSEPIQLKLSVITQ